MTFIDMSNLETRDKVVMVTLISALTIEVGIGLKMGRNVNTLATATRLGFTGSRKAAALQWAVDTMKTLDPAYTPSRSTLRALAK
jgi:hypothetical protein